MHSIASPCFSSFLPSSSPRSQRISKLTTPLNRYKSIAFAGKQAQLARVEDLIRTNGFIPENLVTSEVQWFYGSLGIDDSYFQLEPVESVADHIEVSCVTGRPRFFLSYFGVE